MIFERVLLPHPFLPIMAWISPGSVSYTHLRAHETEADLVCRLLLEKKRNEILQMALLEPKIAILDETDSGLDIDALRIVASGIKKISNAQTGIILITHYQRLLDEIKPDYVHVMSDGQIIKTGESDLALELEEKGYEWTDNFIKET